MRELPTQPALVFAPNKASFDATEDSRFRSFLSRRRKGIVDDWTCQKMAAIGDVYLFWFGKPLYTVGGVGVVSSEVDERDNDGVDWTGAPKLWFCDFEPVAFFDDKAVTIDDFRSDSVLAKWWASKPYRGKPKRILNPKVAAKIIAIIKEKCGNRQQLRRVLRHVPTWLRG